MVHLESDTDLRHDILEALEWADEVEGAVGVSVWNGVVTLTGFVDRADDLVVVERMALLVPGVMRVRNSIQVGSHVH